MLQQIVRGCLFGLSASVTLALVAWTVTGGNADNLTATAIGVLDNTVNALTIGSTGRTNALTYDSTDTTEIVGINSAWTRTPALYEDFGYGASAGLAIVGAVGQAPVGTALGSNYLNIGFNKFVAYNTGASANTTQPVMTAVGLDIGGEQTSGDGWELSTGWVLTWTRPFVTSTDAAFQACVTITVEDASGAADLHWGFIGIELPVATFNNYANMATIGLEGTANPNTIQTISNLAAAGAVVTDTTSTWADAASKALCVLVSASGVVTYTINGTANTPASFTFNAGTMVRSALWFAHGADLAGKVEITSMSVRFQ